MNRYQRKLPPLYRDGQRILKLIEEAVRYFPRYHKYTIGSDLRRDAMRVMRRIHRAVYGNSNEEVSALLWTVDELKLTLQLAHDIGAFRDMRSFAPIAELAAEMGRQCGGWLRRLK